MIAKIGGLLLLAAGLGLGQPSRRMEITLEARVNGQWKVVDPATVLEKDAEVRFRFKANFAGFLYVMNQGTTGAYTQLFPNRDTGMQNRVEPGVEIGVPATDGYFRVSGPEGYDIVYWMVTPLDVTGRPQSDYKPLPPPPPVGKYLGTLRPRCDDAILKARGDCIDSGAGPKKVENASELPKNMQVQPDLKSRDLIFIRDKNAAIVSTPSNLTGPVVYEFRLAHK